MKKNKKVYFLDFDQQIEKKNLSDKYFLLNEFKDNKRNIIYIEKILYKKEKSLQKRLLKDISIFQNLISRKIKDDFKLYNFNFLNLSSFLHPDVMTKNNDHYLFLKCILIQNLIENNDFKKIYLNTQNVKLFNFFKILCKNKKINLVILSSSLTKKILI